jgi:hypothetical protein
MILEVLFNLPGLGPFVNLALESILGTFFLDSSLQPFLESTKDHVLAVKNVHKWTGAFVV